MSVTTLERKENAAMDVCKLLASIAVVQFHLPSCFSAPMADAYFRQWFFRFCVPFFFACSGYFFSKAASKGKYIRRIALLYALSSLLYLPAILAGSHDLASAFSKLRWNLIFGYEHLWYLAAALEGMILWLLLEKIPVVRELFSKFAVPLALILLLTGAVLDEYYPLLDIPLIGTLGELLSVFGGPRNVIFMGFPLLVLGGAMARYQHRLRRIPTAAVILAGLTLSALAFAECGFLLSRRGLDISSDLSFFGVWPAFILLELTFRISFPIPGSFCRKMRKMSEYIYILHPMISGWISQYLSLSPLGLLIFTVLMCALIALLLEKQRA